MLSGVDRYRAATGKSDSFVGREAINDDKFIGRIRSGGNFTVETYQRVMNWLAAQSEDAA